MKHKRRLVEWGKDLLILLLTLSALYLLSESPLARDSGLPELLSPSEPAEPVSNITLSAASRPARMAVYYNGGRYAVQYDQDAVDQLFSRFGPLLGEGLASAGEPCVISEAQWQACLAGPSVYFDFSGHITLSVLASWLQQEECALAGSARRILLAAGEGDSVLLCYEDGGCFYACGTGLTQELHLLPAVEGFEGNGALFAFEDDALRDLLAPYTLVAAMELSGAVYAAATPLSAASDVSWLLSALSYGGQSHTTVSGGEAYLDGGDRLLVGNDGTVTYRAAQEGKYPVPAAGSTATAAEVIEAVRDMAERTIGAQCGAAQIYLVSAEETEEGWLVRFGYRLNGSAVWLYDEGWAAEFRVREGCVDEFFLRFRSYTATADEQLLLPIDKAAAMLPSLTDERLELTVQYRDMGGADVVPAWVAE